MKNALLILFTIALFSSCEKKYEVALTQTKPDPDKEFLKTVKPDEKSEYFISGEFDGHEIYCASTFVDRYPDNSTVLNALFINNLIKLDNIHLVRFNKLQDIRIAIYFDQADILNRAIPYTLPHQNQVLCERVEVQLLNLKKAGSAIQNSQNDNFSFHSSSYKGITLVVTSFKDYIMEGTFKGNIRTNTGSSIIVENGKFRIKLKIVDQSKPVYN
ncbi:hypothetical protein [Pedobacter cryophilus]|uniref:Lipoprotein n=1 Tax=Pedobacter cryophilus TaxID=2571271 RepID=A0A4U1C1L6_9SPHI|nr:hypothetical protein [Pedobacter cryophilus]TKB96957.1 hypothetical protein FA046_12870 [Pedobacter cryophilus]